MSKIKSNRLEPRATNGSLTIGNPESYTTFEGDVQIPGYATEEYVQNLVTGDIAVELTGYQSRDEKNVAGGYAGLDSTGRVPSDRIDTDVLSAEVDDNKEQIATNTAKIEQMESATAFQIEYFMGNKAGTDPTTSYMAINADDWESTTQIKMNSTDAGGAVHDFSAIKAGDTIWFADVTPDGAVSADVDTTGVYTVDSVSIGASVTTLGVTPQSTRGAPTVGDRVEAELFPAFDVSSKADIVYVDTQDQWIKDNYLPLSAGTSHKLTGDIYAAQHAVKGLKDAVDGPDAVSKDFGDGRYLKRDGSKKITGNINMDSHDLNNVGGIEMESGAAINWATGDPGGQLNYAGVNKLSIGNNNTTLKTDLAMSDNDINNVSNIELTGDRSINAADGTAGLLKYSGDDKFKFGNELWAYEDLSMEFNAITKLKPPENPNDAATKDYVDAHESLPVEIGTAANPPSRPAGSMYMTSGGNIYVYS